MKRLAKSLALTFHSSAFLYVSRGSKMAGLTPGNSVGTSKSKYGICLVGALSMEPSKMASMIPLVSFMEIRLPVPFQPVLTKYAFAPAFSIFLTNSSAYFVGCSERNAAPKHAEKVGVGSVIPLSVPANLAVNPDKK